MQSMTIHTPTWLGDRFLGLLALSLTALAVFLCFLPLSAHASPLVPLGHLAVAQVATTGVLSGLATTAVVKLLLMAVGLAASLHLGTKAYQWLLAKLKPANVHISTNHTVNDVINGFLNGGEHLLTSTITGDKLDALLQLIASGATGSAILDWLKVTFGADIAQKLLADLGPVGQQAAVAIFGSQAAAEAKASTSLVVAARQVATKLAQQQLTAAQVKAGLLQLSQPPAGA